MAVEVGVVEVEVIAALAVDVVRGVLEEEEDDEDVLWVELELEVEEDVVW